MNFKKVKFNFAHGKSVETKEGKNISLDEAIRILKDENVISFSAVRMTSKEYFKGKMKKNS